MRATGLGRGRRGGRPEQRLAWLGLVVALAVLVGTQPVRAIGTSELLDVVIQAVEPQLAPAKPLILCLLKGTSLDQCVNQELKKQAGAAEQQAGAQAAAALPFNPGDNQIQQIVAIVRAAEKNEWVKVLEIGGPTVAKMVGCAALPPGVKAVGCPVVEYVVDHNKSVLDKAQAAVREPDWWALVTLLGPETACNFIPIPEIKSTLCGPLGAAVKALADFAEGGAKAIGKVLGDAAEVLVDFSEDLAGQDPPMAPAKYFEMYWRPTIHWYLLAALTNGTTSVDFGWEWKQCVSYFDSHKASRATAEKWCGKLGSQAHAHFNAAFSAIKAAPAAYLAGRLRPQIPRLAITWFDPQPGELAKVGQGLRPSQAPYAKLYEACVYELRDQIGVPGVLPRYQVNKGKWNSDPDDAWKWACDQALRALSQELNTYRTQGGTALLAKMSSLGCKRKVASTNSKLYLVCETHDGYDQCRREITSLGVPGHEQCESGQQAGAKLALQIAAELGAKRCAVVPNYGQVRCTRPWKVEQCQARAMPPDDAPAWHGARVGCELQADPQFTAGQQQVQQVLSTVKDSCWPISDPLAIRCSSDDVLAAHQISLPPCPLEDPSRDGVDAPCLVQVLRARSTVASLGVKPVGQAPVAAAVQAAQQQPQAPTIGRATTPPSAPPPGEQPIGRSSAAAVAVMRQMGVSLEAEALAGEGRLQLRGGQALVQPMAGFGPGWSGGAQLFWHGGGPGSGLDLLVDVPRDGAWIVEIDLTRAPDYGQLAFTVDQHPVAERFEGFAPGVAGPVTMTLGTFAMQRGLRPVGVTVVGRHQAATGFLIGIDRVRLRPSGN